MKHSVRSFGIFTLTILLSTTQVSANTLSRPTAERDTPDLFVKATPTGIGDCATWTDACDLQYALNKAGDGMEVWVAAGTHKPHATDRAVSFVLNPGVRVYGGFPAAGGTWEQRDWQANKTYLSGDIGTAGVITDNSYRVVTAGTGVGASTILDGFYIVSGNANGATNPLYTGGGMYCYDASPILTNIQFGDNRASQNGGGMANYHSSKPSLTNVYFTNNTAAYGGGMFNSASSDVQLSNVTFNKNTATENGGGMYNVNNSRPSLYNVTFESNLAHHLGGGMYNTASSPTLDWVQFTSNQANEHGGGMFNYNDSNPKITNTHFTSNTTSGNGGGMYNDHSLPDLLNVYFETNTADHGGGIFNSYSSPNLRQAYFAGNEVEGGGGGMYNQNFSSPHLVDIIFTHNTAFNGGGVLNDGYCHPVLSLVTFNGNEASNLGGGLFNYFESSSSLTDIIFKDNLANSGAGLFNEDSHVVLNRVIFTGNIAGINGKGGGIFNDNDGIVTLTNGTFDVNRAWNGADIYNNETCSFTLTNGTITKETGTYKSIFNMEDATLTVTNSIIWGLKAGFENYGTLTVTYSDVQGGISGAGNIDQDPLLGDLASNGGYTQTRALNALSPAIDTIDPVFCPTEDQRGYVRPIDGDGDTIKSCDMGAYEYGSYLMHFIYLPLTIR